MITWTKFGTDVWSQSILVFISNEDPTISLCQAMPESYKVFLKVLWTQIHLPGLLPTQVLLSAAWTQVKDSDMSHFVFTVFIVH